MKGRNNPTVGLGFFAMVQMDTLGVFTFTQVVALVNSDSDRLKAVGKSNLNASQRVCRILRSRVNRPSSPKTRRRYKKGSLHA